MAIAFSEYAARRASDEGASATNRRGASSPLSFPPTLDRAAQAPLVQFMMVLNELELHRVVQLLQRGGVDLTRARVDEVRSDGEQVSTEIDDTLTIHFGTVEVNLAARTVRRGGFDVHLAPKEFDLLVALLRRDGAAASRSELAREVWGSETAASGRTIDTHVCALRRKLEEDQRRPRHIRVVSKVGYRLER